MAGNTSYRSRQSRSTRSRSSYPRQNNNNRRSRGPRSQNINPERFIKAANPVKVDDYKPTNQFDDFNLHPTLKRNVSFKRFNNPSHIQDIAIPHALEGKDVIGIASTGTGKTIAFAIPVINKLLASRDSSALIVAPTRELAQQIENEIKTLLKSTDLYTALVIGGTPMHRQTNQLRRRPNIVIGTPGRLLDHVKRGNIKLHFYDLFVLDEVDRMVDMGFINDVRAMFEGLPANKQSLVFSATMNDQIESLVRTFLSDPIKLSTGINEPSQNVEQNVVRHTREDKIEKLHDILNDEAVKKTLIFSERKHDADKLTQELISRGFKADAIHGDKTQGYRQKVLRNFKESQIDILVATDVAARGISVPDITHVINYDIPSTYDDYIHRIGRAGRANNVGYALTFVSGGHY